MSKTSESRKPKTLPTWTKFAIGALGGATGWMFIHPIDVVKVRAQINTGAPISPLGTAANIFKTEGPKGLYAGLSAAITRQFTYGMMRLGLYDVIRERITSPGEHASLWKKMACGLSAGGIAAALCNPVEVALVRMQADGAKPLAERRGYRHVFAAWAHILKHEGVAGLYIGVAPTVTRGMVVSMTQLATYDQAKQMCKGVVPDGMLTHFTASLIAGFVYCAASLPLDVCKSRIQNQKTLEYRGVVHALTTIPAKEGVLALWKGFLPYYTRGGGHSITMFIALEQYRNLFKYAYGIDQPV